jgi:DNA-binding transcriptional LysR family regulator
MAGMAALMSFAETVKQGSFAGAARELGLSPSAVAKAVARLEADLGLRLLHRTTRRVSLTGDGTELHERCRRIVEDMEALREEAEGVRGKPRGTLRLNSPITWGRQVLVPKLAALARAHPELSFDVTFTDRFADLVREGFDAAVRVGTLSDSSLVARRIGTQQMIMIASPAYLKQRGTPAHPDELGGHDHLAFRMPTSGRPMAWRFVDGKRAIELVPQARTVFDDGDALARGVAEGMGMIQIPSYMAAADLKARRVVELLAAFRPPPMPISLVLPSARQMTPRIRVLVAALAEGTPDPAVAGP